MPGSPATRPAPDLPEGHRLALVVATTTYADPALRQLRAPARDAVDLRDVLADPAIGGFDVTSVVDGDAQAVRLAMEEFVSDRSPDDLLVVYLSCHGLVDARRRLYFAATDTLKNRLAATGVEAQWLLDQLEDCRARRQVVILDCCFSGAFATAAKGDTDLALGERFHGQGRGRVVLTASRATEYSFEGEPLADSAMTGSVFTSALVAGLRTGAADLDRDGYVSVDDAYTYAFDRIQATDAQQTPQRWLYGAEGTILLARSPAGVTIVPAALPEAVRSGLESPQPAIRLGAVSALGEWLADADPARVVAAQDALRQVAENDIPRVASVAESLLHDVGEPAGEEGSGVPAPAPVPVHVSVPDRAAASAPGRRPTALPSTESAGAGASGSAPARRRRLAYAVPVVFVAAGAAAAFLLTRNGNGATGTVPVGSTGAASGTITAAEPWRLVVRDEISENDNGCNVTVQNVATREERTVSNYGTKVYQVHETGTFRWAANDRGCLVAQRPGSGNAKVPFAWQPWTGDSDAFAAPKAPGKVIVEVIDFAGGSECKLVMRDAESGQVLDFGTATKESGPVQLEPNGRSMVYLAEVPCGVRVSTG